MAKNKTTTKSSTLAAAMTMLLGSSLLPSHVEIAEGITVQLGDVVGRAYKDSGLTEAEWNALAEADREARLAATVAIMRTEAAEAAAAAAATPPQDPGARTTPEGLEDDSTNQPNQPGTNDDAGTSHAMDGELPPGVVTTDPVGDLDADLEDEPGNDLDDEAKARLAAIDAEIAARQPRTYRVRWDLLRNGQRYLEGDTITLTAADALSIGACIQLEE